MLAVDTTPLATIDELLMHCQPQVARIVTAILDQSALAQELGTLADSLDLLDERLAAIDADHADCEQMLARLGAADFERLPEFAGLDADETADLRRSLQNRLLAHRAVLQNHRATLARGLALGRNGMVNRFATFAVAGLAADGAASMPSGLAFLVAFQVAAQLKDRLETAGYRWAGEKTLITLYLNAIGCERRQAADRQVADPAASVIASRLGFRSARELHQALHALHAAGAGETGSSSDGGANLAARFHRIGHVAFDRAPCAAFDARYAASSVFDDAFLQIMQRVRNGPAAA